MKPFEAPRGTAHVLPRPVLTTSTSGKTGRSPAGLLKKGLSAFMGKGKFISPEEIDGILALIKQLSEAHGLPAVLLGGVALQAYGSPRLTKDIDFALPSPFPDVPGFKRVGPLNFGGDAYVSPEGAQVDLIVRNDEYASLYEEVITNSTMTDEGIQIATPEYLAATKFAANRDKHLLDLKWMLKQPGLVDIAALKNLVYRLVGGKFAQEALQRILDEVELDLRRGDSEPGSYP